MKDARKRLPLWRATFVYYTYVLLSLKDHKQYIGYTSDLKKRIKEHFNGESFATKSRLPFRLMFYEAFISKEDAIRREKYISTYTTILEGNEEYTKVGGFKDLKVEVDN